MLTDNVAVDLDETSFNLENVEMMDDDVDVHNSLICDDRVGIDVNVEPNVPYEIDEEKKKEFEKTRDEILAGVPEEVKARFGEIYFSTFGKFVGPVLVLDPYRVNPGELRDHWMVMCQNCKKGGREDQMTHLTYWYGNFNDLANAYSFQKTSQLLSYESGMKRTEKKLNTLKQKQQSGKKLNKSELNFVKGFDEMEADRLKDPSERQGYVEYTRIEEYYIDPGEATPEKVQEDVPKKEKTKTKAGSSEEKKKKKKLKKIRDSAQTDTETTTDTGTQEVVENGTKPKPKKKLVKKRTKKADRSVEASRPKKRAKGTDGDVQSTKTPDKPTETNIKSDNKKKDPTKEEIVESVKEDETDKSKTIKPEERRLSAYEEYAALCEESSKGGSDDASLHMGDLQSSDDSADEDYMEASKSKSKQKKKKTLKKKTKSDESGTKTKEKPKKKLQQTKNKIEKGVVKGENKSAIRSGLKRQHKQEQRKFRKCEVEYLPLLRRWEKATANKDVDQMSRIYDELLGTMEDFTAPFIEEYGMADLMKRSKGFENEKRKEVLSKFKKVYREKKDAVPPDFKAVKESEKYIPVDVKSESSPKTESPTEDTNLKEPTPQPESNKDGPSSIQEPSSQNTTDITQEKLLAPIPTTKSGKDAQSTASDTGAATTLKLELTTPPQKQIISTTKTEKKKSFSLGKLMRPGSSLSNSGSAAPKRISSSEEISGLSSRSSKKNEASNPSWIVDILSNEKYSDENREFGLEFLQQAAYFIPDSKSINHVAIARNLEVAIYNWSKGNANNKSWKDQDNSEAPWLDKYWSKIHDLAACISGKRQEGTLAGMIAEGKFATPDDLIGLDDDDLWRSFQGSPLEGFS